MFDSLSGITFGRWAKLLSENNFNISKQKLPLALLVTISSIRTSFMAFRERAAYQKQIEQTAIVKDPIFIIGHWRSGTTFLHTILSQDTHYAYPNLIDIKYPHSIILRDQTFQNMVRNSQSQKRAMDNIKVDLLSPQEEEFAIAIMTLKSSLLNWMFPKNKSYLQKYLRFKNVPSSEIAQWKATYLYYLKKLTYKYHKPLLLKSPSNTAKIHLLLELFPKARFIHIHRNPYHVFLSTKKLYQTAVKHSNLQMATYNNLDDIIIEQYKDLYDAYWEDKSLIPDGHLYEIAFEDLEKDPLTTINTLYEALNLGDFNKMESTFKAYFAELSNYKKNIHPELDPALRDKIKQTWRKNFEEWNYQT